MECQSAQDDIAFGFDAMLTKGGGQLGEGWTLEWLAAS